MHEIRYLFLHLSIVTVLQIWIYISKALLDQMLLVKAPLLRTVKEVRFSIAGHELGTSECRLDFSNVSVWFGGGLE